MIMDNPAKVAPTGILVTGGLDNQEKISRRSTVMKVARMLTNTYLEARSSCKVKPSSQQQN